MPQLWRLTRNRYGRAVYDALARVGVTATVMVEYVAPLADADPPGSGDGSVAVERCDSERIEELDAPTGELLQDEDVLGAFVAGEPVGYLFLSMDATHEIHPLEESIEFDGAYVRRVYVDRSHRNEGVATALLTAAKRRAIERGAARTSALVAVDNRPSRALFEGRGFEPRRRHRYVRVGPLSHRSVRQA